MKPQYPTHNSTLKIPPFRPWRLLGFVFALLILITIWLKWYTGAVSMPRYCENPSQTLIYVEKVITEVKPAEDNARRPYIVAAKLLYLIPQQREETIPDYLQRLSTRIAEQCR